MKPRAPRLRIPLARDPAGAFLPWIVAMMVFFATLALAAAMLAGDARDRWEGHLARTLTVQIPATAPDAAETSEARLARVAQLLAETEGITDVKVIGRAQVEALLTPWLGPEAVGGDLPLPRLVDATLAPDARVDMIGLAAALDAAAPGATLDAHQHWLEDLLALGLWIEAVAAGTMALILVAAVTTIAFSTRSGLSVHRQTIEVMHLIGARDGTIAALFQDQAARLAVRGAAGGFALAAAVLAGIAFLTRDAVGGLMPDLALGLGQWLILLLLVPAAGGIAVITARLTVLRALRRLD